MLSTLILRDYFVFNKTCLPIDLDADKYAQLDF